MKSARPRVVPALVLFLTVLPAFAGNNLTITAGANTNVSAGPVFTTNDDDAFLDPATITSLWSGADVSVSSGTGGANTQPGNIYIQQAISSTTAFDLLVQAADNLLVSAGGIASGGTGGITLEAGGGMTITPSLSTVGGAIALQANGTGPTDGIWVAGDLRSLATNNGSQGGDISLTAAGSEGIHVTGLINSGASLPSGSASAGDITLSAPAGDVECIIIAASAGPASASNHSGNVVITAAGNIGSGVFIGGDSVVSLLAGGSISSDISVERPGSGGSVTMQANGTGLHDGVSAIITGVNGNISITSAGGDGIQGSYGSYEGDVTLAASAGSVYMGPNCFVFGNFTVTAAKDIGVEPMFVGNGAVSLVAGGSIYYSGIAQPFGNAGAVTLRADGTGAADGIFAGVIRARADFGHGGHVSLTAAGGAGIQLGGIDSSSYREGYSAGSITLQGDGMWVHELKATSNRGHGGNISLTATGSGGIHVSGSIDNSSYGNDDLAGLFLGGTITLSALAGDVDIANCHIVTTGAEQPLTISAAGSIMTGLINAGSAFSLGGAVHLVGGRSLQIAGVDISTPGDAIDAGAISLHANGTGAADGISVAGDLRAAAGTGNGGAISLTAAGGAGIGIGVIDSASTGGGTGGHVALTTLVGDVHCASIQTGLTDATATAGNVTVAAARDIGIDALVAQGEASGGVVNLTAGRSIALGSASVDQASAVIAGHAGSITLQANGMGMTDGITLNGGLSATANSSVAPGGIGGAISVTAAGGAGIRTLANPIQSFSSDLGTGGNITLTALAGDVDATGSEVAAGTMVGGATSGNITISAARDIRVGTVNTMSNLGNGGVVSLVAGNSIAADLLNNVGETGSGGITLTAPTIAVASLITGAGAIHVTGQSVTLGPVTADGTMHIQPQAGHPSTTFAIGAITGTLDLSFDGGTTIVNTALGSGTTEVTANGNLKLGSVSQTLGSLTIGAGATVSFTSGLASFTGTGKGPAFSSGSNVVPEPGSAALLAGGFTLLALRRRRSAL